MPTIELTDKEREVLESFGLHGRGATCTPELLQGLVDRGLLKVRSQPYLERKDGVPARVIVRRVYRMTSAGAKALA